MTNTIQLFNSITDKYEKFATVYFIQKNTGVSMLKVLQLLGLKPWWFNDQKKAFSREDDGVLHMDYENLSSDKLNNKNSKIAGGDTVNKIVSEFAVISSFKPNSQYNIKYYYGLEKTLHPASVEAQNLKQQKPIIQLDPALIKLFGNVTNYEKFVEDLKNMNSAGTLAGPVNPSIHLDEIVNKFMLEKQVEEDKAIKSLRSQLKDLKGKYDYVTKQLDEQQQQSQTYQNISGHEPVMYNMDHTNVSYTKGTGTAIALYSDWHIEEKVDKRVVNGLNEFNLEIAEKRALNVFKNTLKLVNKERQDLDIDRMILWLGGDFISGYIHEELMEDNLLSPIEAILMVKNLLVTGIQSFLDKGDFSNITAVCNVGNHGRVTHRMRYSTGYKNSYEWMLYKSLQSHFIGDSRIKFLIPEADLACVQLYGKTMRFFHGHQVKFGGGIGGMCVPLIKGLARFNQQYNADYNFLGHFHQLVHPTKDCTVNGSLIGFNAYAQSNGFAPEPPVQGFKILDATRGFTMSAPIITWE